jgi:hypothetical protein
VGADGLRDSVERFNASVEGGQTPAKQSILQVELPSGFAFGDSVFSQDFTVTTIFRSADRYALNVFGEVFNLFNVANLDGYGLNLPEPSTFGQPNRRATQAFGSGGPRAFQVGGRISF